MMKFCIAAATATLALSAPAFAQAEWGLDQTCSVVAPSQPGKPQLQLSEYTRAGKKTRFVQVFTETKLKGKLAGVSVQAAPFEAISGLSGQVSKSRGKTFLRVAVDDSNWPLLLRRISSGNDLIVSAGGETITIPLAGSGTAVATLQKCIS